MSLHLRTVVVAEIRSRLKGAAPELLPEEAELATLGIDSMDIITILTRLEKRVGLDFDRLVGLTPPRTLADLFRMVERASAPSGSVEGSGPEENRS